MNRSFSSNYNNNFAPKMLDEQLGREMLAKNTLTPEKIILQTMFFGGGYNSNYNTKSSTPNNISRTISSDGYWSSRGIF